MISVTFVHDGHDYEICTLDLDAAPIVGEIVALPDHAIRWWQVRWVARTLDTPQQEVRAWVTPH